ncbi:MAG: cytochrome c3 family protein [Ignavibacteria bacterium]
MLNKKSTGLIILSILVLTVLISALFTFQKIKAKGIDDCLVCHEDKELTMDRNGKKVSLFVNGNEFKKSMHSGFDCVDCHLNYKPEELPHNPNKKDVDCKSCHDNVKSESRNVHNNVKCYTCHSTHNIKSTKEFGKSQTENCLSCHKNKNVQSFKNSIHDKKNVKCESCHQSGHNVKKISKSEVSNVCGKCHAKDQHAFNNSIHQVVLKDGNKNAPTCIDCHGSHGILKNKMDIESQSCLKCHLDEKMFSGEGKGSTKFISEYKTSIHSVIQKDGKQAAGCTDCHGNHTIQQNDPNKPSTSKTKILETCSKCHKDVVENFKKSSHGQELLKGNEKAPSCATCHGEHNIKSVSMSDEFSKINQVDLCLKCHQEQKLPHKNYKGEDVLISNYKESYHYIALKNGKNAATCADCHGSHEMKKVDDPEAKINRKNIPKTCGQSGCHIKQLNDYTGSIHEVSLTQKHSPDAPNCNTCHGNHQIAKKDDVNNRISSGKGIVQLCSDCHNSVEMTQKYNIPTGRTDSYMNSFHGLAVRGGSKVAANCESCHGYHNIRPSSDTLSSINRKNLPVTCGKCHPGANKTLFDSKIHITDSISESPVLYWISKIYIIMILVVIGGMMIHNIFDLIKKVRVKNKPKEDNGKDGK